MNARKAPPHQEETKNVGLAELRSELMESFAAKYKKQRRPSKTYANVDLAAKENHRSAPKQFGRVNSRAPSCFTNLTSMVQSLLDLPTAIFRSWLTINCRNDGRSASQSYRPLVVSLHRPGACFAIPKRGVYGRLGDCLL